MLGAMSSRYAIIKMSKVVTLAQLLKEIKDLKEELSILRSETERQNIRVLQRLDKIDEQI